MSYLIDTQVLIWLFNNTQQVPQKVLKILENIETEILVSIASIWEIAIKISKAK